ncbi:metal ABC transporter permease [Rhodococcus tukisamuensis]|uniref:Zinc/manganese transport system permease protein n=1 Tax=Rhodococcus tukisamuensis TaxID=168276 RepID=A0A1G6NEY3_9NOCA|nr:metal ABC transporter permease [Rhodococcus tukisamuensis]SDC66430.1 zinc/manganese transport system permease protein [Rhodococcus tukisamuensis]
MNEKLSEALSMMFDWQATLDLLHYDFVQQALLAAAILGLLAGAIGPLIISRQMSFAVHGTSELSLTGASAALLAGLSVGLGAIVGSVVAAVLFGLLGAKARERDSVIGVIMSFGLGLSVLFMWLYPGRTGTSFSLLVGQIVGVGNSGLQLLLVCAVLVLAVLLVVYRPLLFASTDPDVARARGVPIRALSIVFAVLVGVAAALGVQIVGALLVLSLLITPAAAAARITSNPLRTTLLSILFAELAAVGGILLSLAPGVPVSTFVTTISFVIYLICRVVGARRGRSSGRVVTTAAA